MSDVKSLLKKASLPERTISIVTDRALAAEHDSLDAQLKNAQQRRASDTRVAHEIREIAARITGIEQQMADSTIEFKLRGMNSKDWRALKSEHPVGDDPKRVDLFIGADSTSLFNAAVRKSIVSPELDDEDWDNLVEMLTEGEWQKFTSAVYDMNEEGTGVPFSDVASMLSLGSDDE